MVITYNCQADDWVRWSRYFHSVSPVSRRQRRRVTVTWCGIYLLIGFAIAVSFKEVAVKISAVFGAIVACLIFPFLYSRHVNKVIGAYAQDPGIQGGFGPQQITFTEEGFEDTSPVARVFVKWENVTSVVQDQQHLFICYGQGNAVVINSASYSGPVPFEKLPNVIQDFKNKRGVSS